MAETTEFRAAPRRARISRGRPPVEAGRPPEREVRPTAFEAGTPPPIPEVPTRPTIEDRLHDVPRDPRDRERRPYSLDDEINERFGDWFIEEDYPTVKALMSPELFVDYIDHLEHHIQEHRRDEGKPPLSGTELWAEISEEFEQNVTLLFSKLYLQVHTKNSEQFMQELSQENFMRSIKTAQETLSRHIGTLSDRLSRIDEDSDIGQRLKKMKFFKPTSIELQETVDMEVEFETGKKDAEGKPETRKETRKVNKIKTVPVPGSKPVGVKDFLNTVSNHAHETLEIEAYSHNIQVLFNRGAGEHGFWSQVAHYAEENMKSINLDTIHLLPDSDAFTAACQIYTKYLQNEFAMLSWRHNASMFTSDYAQKWSNLQGRVREDLEMLFPKLATGGDVWRLDRAMNIGLGLSKGVWLTEVTNAAWADPGHKGKGEAAYQSYYTNDNAALNALNPQHFMDRWRNADVNNGTMLHIPVAGIPRRFMRRWNHRRLWEEMKKREASYLKGDLAYADNFIGNRKRLAKYFTNKGFLNADGTVNQDKVDRGNGLLKSIFKRLNKRKYFDTTNRMLTMIDYMPNIGKVGSHIDRSGWRYDEAFDGWFIKDANGKLNKLESWKSLENIGFEAVKWFGDSKAELGIMKHYDENVPTYQYLYKKYIPQVAGRDFKSYFDSIKDSLKKGEDPAATFMSRVYVNMLRQRIPSKLIVLERNRQSPDGTNAWQRTLSSIVGNIDVNKRFVKTIYDNSNPSEPEQINNLNEMNRAMHNLMLVEQTVRMDVSEQMKRGLKAQAGDNKDLSQVPIKNYKIDGVRIREVLNEKLPKDLAHREDQINNTIKLFDAMNKVIDEGDYLERFANKIRDNGKPEKYFPFAIAAEEMDLSFASFRNAGPTILKRALGDIGVIEKEVAGKIMNEWFGKLRDMATDGKHDMAAIITMLDGVKKAIINIHGEGMAYEITHHLAYATIGYFRKDEVSRGFFTKWFHMGDKHSLAAEFASGNANLRNIWEWTPSDISKFCIELDRLHILPSNNTSLLKGETVTKKLFGLFPYKTLVYDTHSETDYSSKTLRVDSGATKFDLTKEYITKYLPILAALTFYMMARRAAKEAEGKK